MSSDFRRARRCRPVVRALAVIAVVSVTAVVTHTVTPKFYPDDPIRVDNDRALDASMAKPIEGSNAYDFVENTFFKSGDRRNIRAVNVNTIDEVPDSSWFTNRIGVRDLPIDELERGPNHLDQVDIDGWPIVEGKSRGVTPGYRVKDPQGQLYQIKFDPPAHPEMGSGAEVIGAAIYHALGYNVVEGYIVEVDPSRIVISPDATFIGMDGREKRITRADVDRLLARAARSPNGKYRATLSRFAEGKPLGYFKYYGTRPDDPNDIHPHEHRRELRGSRVFAAWLNHDDSRGLNSLDMLEQSGGGAFVRHYMFDFGSIMGSGSTRAQAPRAGNEYIVEWKPGFLTLATLGAYIRPWALVHYPEVPKSVGRFEADFFDPPKWKPEYPNPAFDNMRPDDAFWAARLVARFSDAAIRAIVAKARYSEPGAAEYITKTLIARRDKVLNTWLTIVNPFVNVSVDSDGVLTFGNAAIDAGVAPDTATYELTWLTFDTATGTATPAGEVVHAREPRVVLP
ncbi:MAG: hypothetical protein ACM36C_07105, partial [Acidobacteriota bacterium]